MSFLQLVLSLDKMKEEIILFWRICQFDRYRNRYVKISTKKYKKYNLNRDTKIPDLTDLPAMPTLCNYGKTRLLDYTEVY